MLEVKETSALLSIRVQLFKASLVVKILTVLVLKYNIEFTDILLEKNVSSFCKCYSHFLSKTISVYARFNDQSFNDTLTNDIVSFAQLGPDFFSAASSEHHLFNILHLSCYPVNSGVI